MAVASLVHTHVPRLSAHRVAVGLLCDVRQGTRPWARIRLEDISANGFRIPWLLNCATDFPLKIRIPGLQVLSSRICWRQGHALGCEFHVPLNEAVFEHIIRQAEIEADYAS
jgi:hypothetical protein